MPSANKFALRVTAGQQYTTHKDVPVNTDKSIIIESDEATIELVVRIKDYRAPSSVSLPATCSYFEDPARNKTRYSIFFALTPKRDIVSDAIVLGNDFDEPIKKYLPPLFKQGLDVVKRMIDPGLEGEPYADKPYLYGPLLSSVNVMRIGGTGTSSTKTTDILHEGADGDDADKVREEAKIPKDGPGRQKFFLDKEKRKHFTFQKGRKYEFDFFNGYLDFNEFALKLPMGVSFNLLRQMGDQKIPPLRYVLRNRETDTLLFHVTFALVDLDDEKTQGASSSLPDTSEADLD